MGPSFTGKAAQDRDCDDHSSHPGEASSRIPRTLNITPSSITQPSGPKAIFRDGMSARGTFATCRTARKRSAYGGRPEVQNGAFDPELTKLESCSLSAIEGNGRMFV
jgi:hypothetical protein